MAKTTKKKNRKLKRQVRKTVGALLMVSAITVAAIPVQDINANPAYNTGTNVEKIKVAVTSTKGEIQPAPTSGNPGKTNPEYGYASAVPYVVEATGDPNNQVIYTSGDGIFKFAYIRGTGAVILDYDDPGNRTTVTIPERLEAYRNYSENYQGQEYYCLVSANDELLGYTLRDQPLINEETGRNYYRTIDRMPDGINIDNIEKIEDTLIDEQGQRYINYEQTMRDENGQIIYDEEDGTPKTITARANVEQMMGERTYPCYYGQREIWSKIPEVDLVYHPKVIGSNGKETKQDDYSKWETAGNNTNHWGIRALVKYIGAEKVNPAGASWILGDTRVTPNDGVFANTNYLTNVNIEASLDGVSDYAFYNCTQLNRVEFKPGLQTLGNGAFAGCMQLRDVILPTANAIGKDAFYNCTSLTSFKLPSKTLMSLGDCAFEGCTQLTNVDFLLYDDSGAVDRRGSVPLQRLGNHLFRGCTALSKMEFPNGYFEDQPLDIDMFQGCRSLQAVILPDTDSGEKIDFDSIHVNDKDNNYPFCIKNTWEEFRNTVPESFYFEGPPRGKIKPTANNNSLTYKYPGEQLYEKVVYEHDAEKDKGNPSGKSAKVFYKVRVDGNNVGRLEEFGILDRDESAGGGKSHPDIISIPEKIGSFGITVIDQGSFNNNCDLKKVTIPASVTTIGANAFKGCHELETVIFTDATKIQSIGTDAFRTQEAVCTNPKHTLYPDTYKGEDIPIAKQEEYGKGDSAPKPKLYFVGAMLDENNNDTETFKYAMNGTSKINHNNSDDIWITCHSGWPTNLEVQYYYDPKESKGEAQLVGYPRYDKLSQNPNAWAEDLPYVTDDADHYAEMVKRAIQFNNGVQISPPITPNEQAFLASTLNVVIPASVDSIKPGLFSGYTYDKDGKPIRVDEEGNALEIGDDGKPILKEDENGKPIPAFEPDKNIKSILINGVKEIEPYTFKDCDGLISADIIGSSLIDDYAFEDCNGLANVTLGSNLEDTGKRPFKACDKLMNINCDSSPSFVYDSGILYRISGNGKEIVECLENRGKTGGTGLYTVGPDELIGVNAIREEAFADCKKVSQVDLSKTTIGTVTEGSFKNMKMNSIILPTSLSRIESDAFTGGESDRFVVYYKNSNPMTILPDAFEPLDGNKNVVGDREVIFQCSIPSNADTFAKDYAYITTSDAEVYQEYIVRFYNRPDYPSSTNLEPIGGPQTVRAGENAVEPDTDGLTCKDSTLTFIGWDKPFTNVQSDLDVLAMYGAPEYTVTFIDSYTGATLKTETVKRGQSATPPADEDLPKHPGQTFVGWDKPHYNITENTTIVARYADSSGDLNRHKVSFYLTDDAEEEWWITYANDDEVIMGPMPPERAGYTFVRWMWVPASSATGIKQDTSVYAQWTTASSGKNPNASPGNSGSNNNGSNNNGSSNNGSNSSPSPSVSPTPEPTPGVKKYTVSVSGGSGSGEYAAGEIVAVNAYYMGEGQVFDRWTSSTAGVGFSNPNATSATFTMPAANVAVTATYKTGNSGSSSVTPVSSSGGGGNPVNTVKNNGTVVDITRPGISNTNLAGATVSGATDNFIVKVTENQAATDAVTAALQARYGDLSRIKYLPMDISLYDSTGRTKIADTSGISVNLTIPLPDDLVQYAGNNRVAVVPNGVMEDLNVRFTTVDGVPCVNFTATHFSPYVIYVDTANLSDAVIDATPKTGDPIHPKWFLAIGLACISLILFFKRDKVIINTKTA